MAIKNLSDYIEQILNGTETEKARLQQTFFKLADTAPRLQQLGLRGEHFIVRYGVVSHHKGKDADHSYSADEWKQLCVKINAPLAVTRYKDSYNVYVDVQKNGKPTLVGVAVKQAGRELVVNSIKTVFAKHINDADEIVYDGRSR